MPNQEHVCIAITKSEPMGGAQKYVLTLAQELVRRGRKVTVVAGGTGTLFAKLDKAGIPYCVMGSSQRDISVSKEIATARELYRILRDIRPDILHLNSSKLGGIGSVIGRLAGIRTIVFTAHGWAFNENRPWWQKAIFYFLYWFILIACSRIICVSKETRRQISSLPFVRRKLVVIYNGIEVPDFLEKTHAKQELSSSFPFLDDKKKWIGVLAELHPIKGHDILLDSLAKMRPELEGCEIVCMGTGELKERLESQTRQNGLEKQVFFTGFVPDASRYLPAFECVILPSRSEAMPLTVIEAGFARVPIIASRVGGIPELITDGETGFLFSRENADELSEKIRTIISLPHDETLRMTASFRDRIGQEFTVEHMVTQTLSTYANSN